MDRQLALAGADHRVGEAVGARRAEVGVQVVAAVGVDVGDVGGRARVARRLGDVLVPGGLVGLGRRGGRQRGGRGGEDGAGAEAGVGAERAGRGRRRPPAIATLASEPWPGPSRPRLSPPHPRFTPRASARGLAGDRSRDHRPRLADRCATDREPPDASRPIAKPPTAAAPTASAPIAAAPRAWAPVIVAGEAPVGKWRSSVACASCQRYRYQSAPRRSTDGTDNGNGTGASRGLSR